MFKHIIAIASLAIGAFAESAPGAAAHCTALAMSGGGSKGAFEAGALYGMYHGVDDAGTMFDYDVVTGVSAGAINAAGLSLWPKEKTKEAIQEISDTWAGLQYGDLYKNWWFGPVRGLIDKSGLYDTSYLYRFLQKYF